MNIDFSSMDQYGGTNFQGHGEQKPVNHGSYDYQQYNPQLAPEAHQPKADPFANQMFTQMAMQYGQTALGESAKEMNQKVSKFFSLSSLKYYFAVDNSYVASKLGLLIFPFAQKRWTHEYEAKGVPVPPKADINAPDLYIPTMAFITYILVSAMVLGYQDRFSPEVLGIQSSQAMFWVFLEIAIFSFAIYILNIQNNLSYYDMIAYSCYKFVSMIVILAAYLLVGKAGFYGSFAWTSAAISFFLIRTLKVQVLGQPSQLNDGFQPQMGSSGKQHLYFLLFIAVVQPLMMYCLTSKVIFNSIIF